MPDPTMTYRLIRQWQPMYAAWHYVLYVKSELSDGETNVFQFESMPRSNDDEHRAWAERNAEHFGIEIEEDDDAVTFRWAQPTAAEDSPF